MEINKHFRFVICRHSWFVIRIVNTAKICDVSYVRMWRLWHVPASIQLRYVEMYSQCSEPAASMHLRLIVTRCEVWEAVKMQSSLMKTNIDWWSAGAFLLYRVNFLR